VLDRHCRVQKKNNKTWPVVVSTFVLNRICDVSMDKGFRQKYIQVVVEAVLKFSGRRAHPNQIYNHLKRWRAMFVQILKIKRLEDVLCTEETTTVIMDNEVYFAHIKIG
jgi:hypothetical protein